MPARRHLMGRGVAEETRASTGSGQFWGARAVPSRTTGGSGVLTGIWLSTGQVQMPIETLLLEMLEPTQPNPTLRRSVIEELTRPVKRTDVVLEYLGLRAEGWDTEGDVPFLLASPQQDKDPWREALLRPGGACPIGVLLNTSDRGQLVLIHQVFAQFSHAQKELIRRYAALASTGYGHAQIVATLSEDSPAVLRYTDMLIGARQQVQTLAPSVLFSPDGEIRVQLGSLSQTTRNLLREGLRGDHLFILPPTLFEGRTNYGDIEFLIYLNFFVRQGRRTRIAGTARQQRTLERLLTLTIFGLFDPKATEAPSFEQLRDAYGVRDRETYDFLRLAYAMYAEQRDTDLPATPLGAADYMEYTVLRPGGSVIPIAHDTDGNGQKLLGEVRVAPSPQGGFEVSIVQADGRAISKHLEATPSRWVWAIVPDEQRRAIQFSTDRPSFGVTPLGTSHGFDPAGDMTSFVVWINGKGMLVDPSPEALAYLEQSGVAPMDIPYAFLTHVHADHDGGLIEKVLIGRQTTVIASDPVFRAFTEKAQLITGHNFEREGLITHIAANPGVPVTLEIGGDTVTLESRWNLHTIPTNGFKVHVGGRTFGYSGDTQYDPELLDRLRAEGKLSDTQYHDLRYFFWTPDGRPTTDLLYHEAGIPPIHTEKAYLQRLPDAVTAGMYLVHVADRDIPDGYVPAKPPLFTTHVLLPPTPPSRRRILLETLRLVCYLYDIPAQTLEELLRGGQVQRYAADEVIIQKERVGKHETLRFYVVVDGEVAVKEGRRLMTKLGKADSFGEWGISHLSGFQVADVVALRPCQCLQFTQAQYRWLVERHPVVQERIGKIRSFLPRLQFAQARARLKAEMDPSLGRSVITDMTTGQLSGVAIFSEVRVFREGQAVVVEGEAADGFYILLSGHLLAKVGGRVVGELSEGDVFGEIGLLEGGKRSATVTVASVDAEVLCMNTHGFQDLLQAGPAFSWGIRETAAQRLAISRGAGPV